MTFQPLVGFTSMAMAYSGQKKEEAPVHPIQATPLAPQALPDRSRPTVDDLKASLAGLKENEGKVQWDEYIGQNYHKIAREDIEGRHVLDVGANIGFTSLFFLHMGAKSVIAVEANPENFAVLQNNIAPWPQIKGLNVAAADGVVKKVKIIEDKGISKTLPDAEGGVTAIGFGELVAMFPPDANDMFMKCDIEGGEYDFLLSARKADIIKFKTAILETHQVPHLEKLAARKRNFLLSYFELMGFEKVSECPICLWFHNPDGTVKDCITLEDQGDAKMVRKD